MSWPPRLAKLDAARQERAPALPETRIDARWWLAAVIGGMGIWIVLVWELKGFVESVR